MRKDYLELYSDYLIASFGKTTATGLSEVLDGAISHDKITRFLGKEDYTSKELWQIVKKDVRAIEEEDGVLIFDAPQGHFLLSVTAHRTRKAIQ
jgi:hypothetical protein